MSETPCHMLLMDNPYLRFGDWLVRRGLINRVELFVALNTVYGGSEMLRLGDALVRSGVLPRAVVESEATQHRSFLLRAADADATLQFPLGEHS
jgi:hypothetical protein